MSSDGNAIVEMAETLTVIAGDNAWAAARAFGSACAQEGKAAEARRWRDVARAVLRKRAAAYANPIELTVAPELPDFAVPYEPPVEATQAPEATPARELLVSAPAVAADVAPVPGPSAPVVPAITVPQAAGHIEKEIYIGAPIPMRARREMMVQASGRSAALAPLNAEVAEAA